MRHRRHPFSLSTLLPTGDLSPTALPRFRGSLTPLRMWNHSTGQYSTALWKLPVSSTISSSTAFVWIFGMVISNFPILFQEKRSTSSMNKDNIANEREQEREQVNCLIINPFPHLLLLNSLFCIWLQQLFRKSGFLQMYNRAHLGNKGSTPWRGHKDLHLHLPHNLNYILHPLPFRRAWHLWFP